MVAMQIRALVQILSSNADLEAAEDPRLYGAVPFSFIDSSCSEWYRRSAKINYRTLMNDPSAYCCSDVTVQSRQVLFPCRAETHFSHYHLQQTLNEKVL